MERAAGTDVHHSNYRRGGHGGVLAALLACCPIVTLHAAERGSAVLEIRTFRGPATFAVDDPAGVRSPAGAVIAERLAAREVPGSAPFEVTSRVVVRARRAAWIGDALLLDPALVIQPFDPAPGHWIVDTGSVRRAAAVADLLAGVAGVEQAYVDIRQPKALRDPNDPRFSFEWHLVNQLDPSIDVNADPAWDAGYTGAGVTIGIVEDRWQQDHPDLAANFNAEASQAGGTLTRHATHVAGVAAAVGFNGLQGAGIAYEAQLSNQIFGSDAEDAAALDFRNDLNDIKSNSWGPRDTGEMAFMPSVVRSALENGAATGRDGLGEIFVWAAGNGGRSNDRVDYDPYASSRFTIAVGAIGDADVRADYNEPGSAMFVVAHSDGNERSIYTTDWNGGETFTFGGTSATAPLAAGAIALVLQANPDLTWRDVQHILADAARMNDPGHVDWQPNGAGRFVNYQYGFGALDAGAAVALAEGWMPVPHELTVDSGVERVDVAVPDDDDAGIVRTVEVDGNIRIESVELILNVDSTYLGDLHITLTSPHGTESIFSQQRIDGQDDLVDHVFTSLRYWDETSAGAWTVNVADRAGGDATYWHDYRLVVHGTPACPGDLIEDGFVGLADLSTFLVAFGACAGDDGFVPAADLDNSGCNDLGDLMRLLENFGASCE